MRNFSAIYVALEKSVTSDPLIVLDQPRSKAPTSSRGTFVNIGYQKQFRESYFNLFLGVAFNERDLSKGIVGVSTYHYGIGYGMVLFQ